MPTCNRPCPYTFPGCQLFFFIALLLTTVFNQAGAQNGAFRITDYGAVGDGTTLTTQAIQAAIDAAAEAGGGRVIVPPGKYLTGGIELRDNIIFELQGGATLLGTDQLNAYATHEGTDQHGKAIQRRYLLSVTGVKNVLIEGKGTIDGQGKFYWETPASPPPQWIKAKTPRPNALLEVADSENITIRDITLTNSPNWTCHIMHSQDVVVDGIRIINDLFAPNADGIDITGSQRVRVTNCDITTCDDAIVLKTWKDGQPCEDVTVTNCTLETLCAALKLGTESYADYRRITFSNCAVRAASRLFAIYVRDGGTVEDVLVSNITGSTKAPLVLNRPIQLMVSKRTADSPLGRIRNVSIEQVSCETDGRILLTSIEPNRITDVRIRDLHLRYPFVEDPSMPGSDIKSSQFPISLPEVLTAKAAIVAKNLSNLQLEGLTITWSDNPVPEDWQIPVRIINGDFNQKFRYDYLQPKQTELGVFWGENLNGGRLVIPEAAPSSPTVQKVELNNATIQYQATN
ncbi:MAG: glycosyl hydrolase family 28 protein [Phaeodactylibacter sp.]|uniref:glycoside hydrolase family 28 protein n=1 Tax=Phaeodactylibacter sp. TaxID=1940289 RepID=UPI0032F04465